MHNHPSNTRLHLIDQFRGLAVLLMAIFHFCYDLSVFNFITFKLNGGFFSYYRYVIVTLFFLSVGAGLYSAHQPAIQWRKFAIRLAKIGAGALFITISTYFMYPKAWVWFGVLHFILVASILSLPLIKQPLTAVITGIGIFLLFNLTDWFNLHFLYLEYRDALHLPRGTVDLTRLIPWLGMVYIGIYVAHKKCWGIQGIPLFIFEPVINWLSKHAFIIYLVHQLPLYALAWLLNKAFH
jgi:uncharacterized membrane protein